MKKTGLIFVILLSAAVIVAIAVMAMKIFLHGDTAGNSLSTAEETVLSTEAGGDGGLKEAAASDGKTDDSGSIEEEEDLSVYLDSAINISLENMTDDIWSGEIAAPDGGSLDETLPVMVSGGGEHILADSFRKIVCVRKEADGSLIPCKIEDEDNEARLSYAAFIMLRDLVASDNWKDDSENTELSDGVKEDLETLPLSPLTLNLIGDKDDYHLFKFSRGNRVDYGELYSSISESFKDMEENEYALIIVNAGEIHG